MSALRAIVAEPGPAPARLRCYFDALMAVKRSRATSDPELFAAYRTLAADAKSVVAAHVDELIALIASIVADGQREGSFRGNDPASTARALLSATSRFHHPLHAAEWSDPQIDASFEEVWHVLMDGLLFVSDSSASATIGCFCAANV